MRRPTTRGLGALLGAAMFVAAAGASGAASGSPLRMQLDDCVSVSRPEVSAMLALELERSNPAGAPVGDDRDLQLIVDCAGRQSVRLTLDRAGARRQQRDLRLYDVPASARPRLLALTIVELLVVGGPAPHAPPLAGAPPVVVTTPAAGAGRTASAWRAGAGASARSFSTAWGQPMPGVAAAVTRDLPRMRGAIALDGAVEAGQRTVSLGRVSVLLISAAVRYELRGQRGRWAYGAGPGLRVGWARLAGTEAASQVQAATVSRWWTGPILATRLDADLGAHLYAGAALEAGKVLQSVRGLVGDRPEVEIGGSWLAAMISFGIR